MLWSIFNGELVDYRTILWDDFITYVGRDSPRQGLTEVTFSRFLSLCIKDSHDKAKLILGEDINFFIYKELKRYYLPKDQSMSSTIR